MIEVQIENLDSKLDRMIELLEHMSEILDKHNQDEVE